MRRRLEIIPGDSFRAILEYLTRVSLEVKPSLGIITETDDGEYIFMYDDKYVEEHPQGFYHFHDACNHKTKQGKTVVPFF